MSETMMYSRREDRWIPAMATPYPPFWWERALHWLLDIYWPHGPEKWPACRVCQYAEYEHFEAYHQSAPAEQKGALR